MRRNEESAFSLIELLIVLGVLGTIGGLYTLNAQATLFETRASVCEKNRTVCEDQELLFCHREQRPSEALQELVDKKYLNKANCPQGGILTWEVADPDLKYAHQVLVCSIHGPRTRIRAWKYGVAAESDQFAFSYDFDDPVATGWSEVRGRYWEVIDGAYHAGRRGRSSGEHRSFSGSEEWTDYTVSLTATLDSGKGYGVYFRATDPKKADAYIFQYDPGYGRGAFLLRRIEDGREKKPFARVWAPADFDWYGVERTISIDVRGDTFTASIDGEEVLTGQDSTWSSGGIGLRTWGNSSVGFDDVRVELHDD